MRIDKDKVVSLNYRVLDTDGEVVDRGDGPLIYLHGGYGGIFTLIEDALQGKAAGDSIEVRLEPADAFGEFDAALVSVEPRSLFPPGIEVGMQFERTGEDDEDARLFTITDIAEEEVVVDGNHPLAGLTLVFTATVDEVRNATAEEVEHGHVHGENGAGH
jgi:FKBP-type peptidyl-prolyl cis-trans isomerase SlyD